jgi:hypothetical protein
MREALDQGEPAMSMTQTASAWPPPPPSLLPLPPFAGAAAGGLPPEVERWQTVARRFREGRVIPFLGAGASCFEADPQRRFPPSGPELLARLAAEAGLDFAHADGTSKVLPDLAKVASYYVRVEHSRESLDALLEELAGRPNQPNRLHRLLARIARFHPMLVLTTNYDSLLELAFDEVGAPYEVVATAADQLAYEGSGNAGPDRAERVGDANAGMIYHRFGGDARFTPRNPRDLSPDLKSRSIIHKVHGSVPLGGRNDDGWSAIDPTDEPDDPGGEEWAGGYLIAEEDYARFLGRMDRDHIFPHRIRNLIATTKGVGARKVMANTLLFLGYSLNDWNLRVLMEELGVGRGAEGDERHYAVLRTAARMEQALLRTRRIKAIEADLNNVVGELEMALTAVGLPPLPPAGHG